MSCRARFFVFIFFILAVFQPRNIRAEGGVRLNDECQNTKQCLLITNNSTCLEGYCSCQRGFYTITEGNNSFCETNATRNHRSRPKKTGGDSIDFHMIIIVVSLVVMFMGIVGALLLFSKARYGKYHSIFNIPHPRLIISKLRKKQTERRVSHGNLQTPRSRQPSVCSQLVSDAQSRRGSQAENAQFSQESQSVEGSKHGLQKVENAEKDGGTDFIRCSSSFTSPSSSTDPARN